MSPIDELDQRLGLVSLEYGFVAAEKGWSLEKAKAEYRKFMEASDVAADPSHAPATFEREVG